MNPTKINWTTAGLFSLSANDNILINNNISMCVDISLLNKRRISMAEKKDNVSAKFKDNVFWGYRTKRVDGLIPFNKCSVIIM